MKYDKSGPRGRLRAAPLAMAAMVVQSAWAVEPASPPDVKKAAKQLEEVMKLLRQGGKDGGDAPDGGRGAQMVPAKPPASAPAKPK